AHRGERSVVGGASRELGYTEGVM
ncbi:hypothetical protein A2U01_0073468, partial [Trifolium medium]|nr:hypothetical protein [Trifolium medium]